MAIKGDLQYCSMEGTEFIDSFWIASVTHGLFLPTYMQHVLSVPSLPVIVAAPS